MTRGKPPSANDGPEVSGVPSVPSDERAVSSAHLRRTEQALALSREAARLAREDLKVLLSLPEDEWHPRVERSRSRMRSRAFVELLLDEARNRLKKKPAEAALLASLARPALDRRKDRLALPWVQTLLVEAEACEANARKRLDR